MDDKTDALCKLLINKGELKQNIFQETLNAMLMFKEAAKEFDEAYRDQYEEDHDKVTVHYTNRNQYEFQLKFAGDILVFIMHTNIFEFSRPFLLRCDTSFQLLGRLIQIQSYQRPRLHDWQNHDQQRGSLLCGRQTRVGTGVQQFQH